MTSEQAADAAMRLHRIAHEVEAIGSMLRLDTKTCDACGNIHYRFWSQKTLRDRIDGAAERLRGIAEVFVRRQNDDEFLNGDQDG